MADQIIVGVDDHSVEAQDRPATQAATLRLWGFDPATGEMRVGVRIGLSCGASGIHGSGSFFRAHDWDFAWQRCCVTLEKRRLSFFF